ncbi:carotenoid oxygenase family protein [Streptomyces sp. NPDC020096]
MSFPDHNGFGCYGIVKYDRLTGDRRIHEVRDARLPSEALFVPAAGATNEDDGYLLTVISDLKQDASQPLVLNASHLDRIATVHLPRRVTAGIHGSLTNSLAAASSRARAAALRSHGESTFCDMIGSS